LYFTLGYYGILSWDQVFDDDDVNKIFNSFLNTHLGIFYASFPIKKINKESNTPWITIGIKTSCIQKTVLGKQK